MFCNPKVLNQSINAENINKNLTGYTVLSSPSPQMTYAFIYCLQQERCFFFLINVHKISRNDSGGVAPYTAASQHRFITIVEDITKQ